MAENISSDDRYDLGRFLGAQSRVYGEVCAELDRGRKTSHWMWFIFPQIRGLGASPTAHRFALSSLDEARAYLRHPVLGPRLLECTRRLLAVEGRSARQILGSPDDLKLRSCLTLFAVASGGDPVFEAALSKYYGGEYDPRTLELLEERAALSAAALAPADALIVVDVQNDFLPGGALGVPAGGEVIAPLNRAAGEFERRGLPVFATRDWHPPGHCSFREQGGPWPPHCIAGTEGAAFAGSLHLPKDVRIVSKATRAEADAYSGFQGTELAVELRRLGCMRAFIGGLATDYCVRATVLDALEAGFEAVVLADAVRAVNVRSGDGARALAEMTARGARLVSTARIET
jgi:nicotinamidase/pyrazinamidase